MHQKTFSLLIKHKLSSSFFLFVFIFLLSIYNQIKYNPFLKGLKNLKQKPKLLQVLQSQEWKTRKEPCKGEEITDYSGS